MSDRANENPSKERERAKRIRDAAREHETDNDPASFERAFSGVVRAPAKGKRPRAGSATPNQTNRGES